MLNNDSYQELSPAFVLLNNSIIYYRYLKQANRYLLATPCFYSALESTSKEKLPLVLGNSNSKFTLIFADFDKDPAIFGYSSYDALRKALRDQLGEMAIVLPSASGKAKVAFLLAGKIDLPKARLFLRSQLPTFVDHLDLSAPAVFTTLIRNTEYQEFAKALRVMTPQQLAVTNTLAESQSLETIEKLATESEIHRWNCYKQDIEIEELQINRSEEFVIRFALGAFKRGIFLSGIQLSTKYIAAQHGNVSQRGISKAINSLIKKGLFRKISDYYAPGRKAKSYRFDGKLLQFAYLLVKRYEKGSINRTIALTPPDSLIIKDGTWNDFLFRQTCYFSSQESFLSYVSKIPGFYDKDTRMVQAVNAWKSHSRRLHRVLIKSA